MTQPDSEEGRPDERKAVGKFANAQFGFIVSLLMAGGAAGYRLGRPSGNTITWDIVSYLTILLAVVMGYFNVRAAVRIYRKYPDAVNHTRVPCGARSEFDMWVTTGVIGLIIIFGLTYWLTGQYLKKEPRAINAPFEKLKDTGGAVVTLGKCNLHFARTKEFLGSGLDWNLYVDGEKMGSLGSGEERDFSIESGRRSICVGRLLLKSKALTRHFLPGETCRAICQSSIWRGIDLHFEDAGGSPLPGDEPSEGFWRGLLSHGLVRMYSLNGVLAILLFLAVALFFFLSVVNYSGSYFEVIVGWLFWGSTIYIACWGLPVGWWWALFAAYLVFLPISLGRVFFFRRERRW